MFSGSGVSVRTFGFFESSFSALICSSVSSSIVGSSGTKLQRIIFGKCLARRAIFSNGVVGTGINKLIILPAEVGIFIRSVSSVTIKMQSVGFIELLVM